MWQVLLKIGISYIIATFIMWTIFRSPGINGLSYEKDMNQDRFNIHSTSQPLFLEPFSGFKKQY